MHKANKEIREALKNARVWQWELADALGVNEGTVTRMLRRELPEAERERVLATIAEIAAGR